MDAVDTFHGTERFEIEDRLGSGAFGVVYRAYDRKMKSVVALKSLRKRDPSRIYRFKQEFRALADITHPNLVTLYELQATKEEWFFTMELIHGVDFLDYVRGGESQQNAKAESTLTLDTTEMPATREHENVTLDAAPFHLTVGAAGRLRAAFSQLAEGLLAIHGAGILHRDIKPSNVLVTPEGRVVVLDFGLVTELAPGGSAEEAGVAGTPAYMSPEQASGQAAGQASDWFGAGVMLYQALTGRLPFRNLNRRTPSRAHYENLAPPSHWAAALPSDLNSLCLELLRFDPGQRPSGRDVLKRLQAGSEPVPGFVSHAAAGRSAVFVGRERHLAALRDALAATREGRTVAARVYGRSGMGKSALIRHFLDELHLAEPGIVILSGRCYERESVPYKALDSLVDTLSQYLQKLPHRDAERLMPRDVASLARLFPVLRRVEAVIEARNRSPEIFDSQELRRRAFSSLRELLGKLGGSRPLVLFIDDLQWGDLDSAGPLKEILREPGSPACLLIASYRSEEAPASPLLRELEPVLCAQSVRAIEVGELTEEEARSLAGALTGGGFSERAASIVAEARGSPFFIELLRSPRARTGEQHLTLDDVIYQRVSELPERARKLLEVVAVAGQPVADDLARRAADFESEDLSLLHLLRTERMLRGRDAGDRNEIETYHDRIRETVLAHLEPAKASAHHLRLAHGYESSGRETDSETMAVHYERGGDRTKAAVYAAAAARKATDALAFDRAARLYRLALDLDPGDPEHSRALHVKLGDALANAGRGDQAARAYLEAAKGASAAEALDLRRRASEQLLLSGHIDEGMEAMRGVLESVGLRMANTPRGALASLLLRRALVRLRGIRFKERDFSRVVPADLVRIDACWSVGAGLAVVDNIYAADFQSRHLLLALKAGEPYRVARALAMEAGHVGTAGRPAIQRCEELLAAAHAVAARVRNPYVHAHIGFMTGMVCFSQGRWQAAREYLDKAEALRAGPDVPTTWESTTGRLLSLITWCFEGNLKEVASRYPVVLKDVRDRGDLYTETGVLNRISHVLWLAADDPARASEELRLAMERWSHRGFHIQHYWNSFAQGEVSLYRGDPASAWKLLRESEPIVERSMMLRVQVIRAEWVHAKGRCAVAMGDLKEAARAAKQVERERMQWTDGLAWLLHAGIAASRGRMNEAEMRLDAAAHAFAATGMALHAAAARRARGLVRGGEEGAGEVAAMDAVMAAQGIRNPARMTQMIAPGEWPAETSKSGPALSKSHAAGA